MSPSGRVNVALAGRTTNIRALRRTLLELAAIGKLTTNNALPRTVATRQTGRTMMTSAAISISSPAAQGIVLNEPIASTQIAVISLVFISLYH